MADYDSVNSESIGKARGATAEGAEDIDDDEGGGG